MAALQQKLSKEDLHALAMDFDHHSEEYREHSFEILAHMQENCPFVHSSKYDGFWVAAKAKTVLEVARDAELFSSFPSNVIPVLEPTTLIPLNSQPPELFDYRAILNPLFAPKKMEQKLPAIRAEANRLMDAIVAKGEGDLVVDFAQPLTGIVTLEMLGINPRNWFEYGHPIHEIVYSKRPIEARRAEMAVMIDMMKVEIRRQLKDPAEGKIIEYLHNVEMVGRKLTLDEIDRIVLLIIAGGLDTTQALLGSATVFLGRNPGRRQELIDHPERMEGAVEEFLRVFAPNQGDSRHCTRDTVINGQEIKAGEQIYLSWIGANLDPDGCFDPLRIDFERDLIKHYTFGVGPHRCLGSHLARQEIIAALEVILAKAPNYKLVEERVRKADDIGTISGFYEVPVTL